MGITPTDLLAVAELLATTDGEAAQRRAVSSAYYAAFHCARDFVQLRVRGGREHQLVAEILIERHPEAGTLLASLRRERTLADYAINEPWAIPGRLGCETAHRIRDLLSDAETPA